MASAWYEQRILAALRILSPGVLGMRLGTMADRDLAIALEVLVPEDRESILHALPVAKEERVRQERVYMSRLLISPRHRQVMAERLADALEGRSDRRGGTWIAPGGKTPDRR